MAANGGQPRAWAPCEARPHELALIPHHLKEFSMNRFRHLIAATIVASLAACSTVLPSAHSGFLSDYTALAGAP
jgi:hypothetical protein